METLEQLGTLGQTDVVGRGMQVPELTKVRRNRQALRSRAMFGAADALRRRLGDLGFTARDTGGRSSGYYDAHTKRRIDTRAAGRGWNPTFMVVKDYAAGRLELEKVIQWRTHGGEKAGANRWGAHVHPPETASALAAASGAAPSAAQVPQAGVQRTIRM